jgi:DNA-binding PadR family transcriptional regulator
MEKNLNSDEIAILKMIGEHQGELSWYQVDRNLARDRDPGLDAPNAFAILRELETFGLIKTGPGRHPAQPLYSLTNAGQEALERGIAAQNLG